MQTIVGSTNNVAEHQPKNNKIHFANVLLYVMSRMSLFHKNHRFHLLKITALQTIIINTAGKIITVENNFMMACNIASINKRCDFTPHRQTIGTIFCK